MEKPTLFWAVIRETYSTTFSIMRVTSYNTRIMHGSIITDNDKKPRSCRASKLLGKFSTKEEAAALISGASKLYAEHSPLVEQKQKEYDAAFWQREKAVSDYLKAGGITR